jgi:hypothetical protein
MVAGVAHEPPDDGWGDWGNHDYGNYSDYSDDDYGRQFGNIIAALSYDNGL